MVNDLITRNPVSRPRVVSPYTHIGRYAFRLRPLRNWAEVERQFDHCIMGALTFGFWARRTLCRVSDAKLEHLKVVLEHAAQSEEIRGMPEVALPWPQEIEAHEFDDIHPSHIYRVIYEGNRQLVSLVGMRERVTTLRIVVADIAARGGLRPGMDAKTLLGMDMRQLASAGEEAAGTAQVLSGTRMQQRTPRTNLGAAIAQAIGELNGIAGSSRIIEPTEIWKLVERHGRIFGKHWKVAFHFPVKTDGDTRWIRDGDHPSAWATKKGAPEAGGDEAGATVLGMLERDNPIAVVRIDDEASFIAEGLSRSAEAASADLTYSTGSPQMIFGRVGRGEGVKGVIQWHARTANRKGDGEEAAAGESRDLLDEAQELDLVRSYLTIYVGAVDRALEQASLRKAAARPPEDEYSEAVLWEKLRAATPWEKFLERITFGWVVKGRFGITEATYKKPRETVRVLTIVIPDPTRTIAKNLLPHIYSIIADISREAWGEIAEGEVRGYDREFIREHFIAAANPLYLFFDPVAGKFVGFQAVYARHSKEVRAFGVLDAAMVLPGYQNFGITKKVAGREIVAGITLHGRQPETFRSASPAAIGAFSRYARDLWPNAEIIAPAILAVMREQGIEDPFGGQPYRDSCWGAVKDLYLQAVDQLIAKLSWEGMLQAIEAKIQEDGFALSTEQKDILHSFAEYYSPGHSTHLLGAVVAGVYSAESGLIPDRAKVQWHSDIEINMMCALLNYGAVPGHAFFGFGVFDGEGARRFFKDQARRSRELWRRRFLLGRPAVGMAAAAAGLFEDRGGDQKREEPPK